MFMTENRCTKYQILQMMMVDTEGLGAKREREGGRERIELIT